MDWVNSLSFLFWAALPRPGTARSNSPFLLFPIGPKTKRFSSPLEFPHGDHHPYTGPGQQSLVPARMQALPLSSSARRQ